MTINQAKQILQEEVDLQLVAQAYTEISANKLLKIRDGILKNRQFFDEISKIFQIVKQAGAKRKIIIKKNAQVSILLTSNHPFYGGLETPLMDRFSKDTSLTKIVIGRTGLIYLKSKYPSLNFTSTVFKDDLASEAELVNFISFVRNFNQILIFYSKMRSVVIQETHIVDIGQGVATKNSLPNLDYIFEPEIHQMLSFFDSQIIRSLFVQAELETELARTAARLMSMDQAGANAKEAIEKQKKNLLLARRIVETNNLLEMVSLQRRHYG